MPTLAVPGTHSRLTSEVTPIALPAGSKRMRVQYAERPDPGGLSTYFLTHVQYTYPAGSAELDRPALIAREAKNDRGVSRAA